MFSKLFSARWSTCYFLKAAILTTSNAFYSSALQLNIKSSFICDLSKNKIEGGSTQGNVNAKPPPPIDDTKNSSEVQNMTASFKVLLSLL